MDDLGLDEIAPKVGGHGGRREGAGRKPKGYVKPPEAVEYDKGRARNEMAKARLNELDLAIKSGQYVSREAVRQAAATTVASFAQTLRSIRDALERRGVPVDTCETVDAVISDAMSDLAAELEMMSNPPQ